jgi:hypothetical protein
MLLYIITPLSYPDAVQLPDKRQQPAFYVTLLCALLMLSAQSLAYAHLHSIDHAPGLECSACTLAKNQLVAVVDNAAADLPLVLAATTPPVALTPAPANSSIPLFQARAPPNA